jgi:multidrug efflux pump subunit AcrA (membrane-fusion protein)
MKAAHGSLLFVLIGNIGLSRVSPYRTLLLLLSCALAPLVSDCSKRDSATLGFGPQEVLITDVTQQDVPVVREWIGSLDGSVNADVRTRVSGYLISQNYKEGTLVHQGDLLFTGIAGIANPGIGDLLGPSDSQPLMTMSTVDPIRVYLKISEQDYLKFARRLVQARAAGEAPPPVEIILADGTLYPQQGKFSAVDRDVDQQTGTIRLQALFPNPNNILRPGGFVRVRVTVRNIKGALLVPQRAVNELQTSYEVAVVGPENKAEIRSVKVGDQFGSLWVIEDGIKPGDRIIVEGAQKVRDGQQVKPMPWTASKAVKAQ